MKKLVVVLLVLMALVLASVGTVLAITDGELDGEDHPNVGLMVAYTADGDPLWRCSGTMLSPTVFLTAGHCVEDPAALASVWFDSDVESSIPGNGYFLGCDTATIETKCFNGTAYQYPNYDPSTWWMDDVGVVVLDSDYELDEYGVLPEVDRLDVMKTRRGKQDTTFTAVGFGLQESYPVPAAFLEDNVRVRMVAYPQLIQINVPGQTGDFSLLLSNNANTGGTCFGDSGGPNFLNDTNTVAGVTSYGKNGNCAGTGGVFRMDREEPLEWVSSFLD